MRREKDVDLADRHKAYSTRVVQGPTRIATSSHVLSMRYLTVRHLQCDLSIEMVQITILYLL
jgi:hypothetical protein